MPLHPPRLPTACFTRDLGHVHSLKTRTHARPSRNRQLCLAAAWGRVTSGSLKGITDLPHGFHLPCSL